MIFRIITHFSSYRCPRLSLRTTPGRTGKATAGRCAGAPVCQCAGAPVRRCAGAPMRRCADAHGLNRHAGVRCGTSQPKQREPPLFYHESGHPSGDFQPDCQPTTRPRWRCKARAPTQASPARRPHAPQVRPRVAHRVAAPERRTPCTAASSSPRKRGSMGLSPHLSDEAHGLESVPQRRTPWIPGSGRSKSPEGDA